MLAGVLSGIICGLGLGGGTILIPILDIFFGIDQHISQGVNLLSFLLVATFAIFIHLRQGFIVKKGLFFVIIPAILFAILGAFLAINIPSKTLKTLFAVFLCAISIIEFVKLSKK